MYNTKSERTSTWLNAGTHHYSLLWDDEEMFMFPKKSVNTHLTHVQLQIESHRHINGVVNKAWWWKLTITDNFFLTTVLIVTSAAVSYVGKKSLDAVEYTA